MDRRTKPPEGAELDAILDKIDEQSIAIFNARIAGKVPKPL